MEIPRERVMFSGSGSDSDDAPAKPRAQRGTQMDRSSECAYIERSGKTHPMHTPRWCGHDEDGRPMPLSLTPLPGMTRSMIDTTKRSLWRYAASFPLQCTDPISLGEGFTPLVARPWGGSTVHFKCEWYNPTCSFKDRGAVRSCQVSA